MKFYYFTGGDVESLKIAVDAFLDGKDATKVLSSSFFVNGNIYMQTIIYNG